MAAKKAQPVMIFAKDFLGKHPTAEYAEFRDAATKKGMKVFPIVYGRAKALLGLVPTSPRGSGKRAKRKKALAAKRIGAARKGPGRPRKAANALDTLGSLVTAMKKSDQDRERYKKALDKISKIIGEIG